MKWFAGWLIALCVLLFCPVSLEVHAETTYDTMLSDLLTDSGADAVLQDLPDDLIDPTALTSFSFWDMLRHLISQAGDLLTEPLQTLSLLLGVVLLSALAGSFGGENDATGTVYETVCVLCAVGIVAEPVSRAFLRSASVLEHTADFTAGFSALYAGVLAVGGGATSAVVYQGSMAAICQIAMEIAAKILLPLLNMCLAMSIVDAVNPAISLAGIIGCIRKTAAWLLGLLMAVFLGMLSVQSMVAVSADRAGTKAAKYMISGAVPIIGGAVSDAYAAVLGSMGVLRAGVGLVGIFAMLSLILPV
ncbi:MAG: stage III sporulation protein AE, partial [Oscillospiraceae bacterium]|nr:stage III sporulation protein AE [Oscillospiraceae bacterium]